MRRIAVAMAKGGMCKTATAVTLAHGLARTGKKVLVIDTDIQGHVAERLGVKPAFGLADTMQHNAQPEHITHARENLDVLAGGDPLVQIKAHIESLTEAQLAGWKMTRDQLVASYFAQHENGYDYVLVDTGPGWDSVTAGALLYSDEVICTVTFDPDIERSFNGFVARITDLWQRYDRPVLSYILPTSYDSRVLAARRLMESFRRAYGPDLVCEPIRQCVNMSYAAKNGQTIFEYDPRSTGAKDYEAFTRKVIGNDN